MQKFTDLGQAGIALFMVAPIVSAGAYLWLLDQLSQPEFLRNLVAPAFLLGAGSLAFLAGCVMLLIGRSQVFTVERIDQVKEDPRSSDFR
ncbi:MAG: hypothetical protein EPN45_00620 [Rhizobiaceae bacterium]|nr:MAG: hypothetical protein EPN45_00620 [Rhizobiaceae bacterium]